MRLQLSQVPTVDIREKSSSASGRGRRRGTILKYSEHSVLLKKVCFKGRLVNLRLTYWGIIRVLLTWGKVNTHLYLALVFRVEPREYSYPLVSYGDWFQDPI